MEDEHGCSGACASGGCSGACGGQCGSGGCSSGACGCGSGHGRSYNMVDYFLEKTDEAWMRLFMDKLKKHWDVVDGKEMDAVIDMLVQAKSGKEVDKEKLNAALEKLMGK